MKTVFHWIMILALCSLVYGQEWRSGAATPIPVRAGNAAAYVSGDSAFLFIVSGRSLNDFLTNATQRYNVKSNQWDTVAVHPTGLLGGATAVLKDSLYVIGGVIDPPGAGEQTVWKYSIRENRWKKSKNLPVGIVDAKAVSYQDSLIYIAGGYTGTSTATVYVYNAVADQWRTATSIPAPSTLNFGGFSAAGDTLVYICGTVSFFSPTYYNDVYIGVIDQTDRSKITWKKGAPFPGSTRTFFDANPWKNGIIMTGGSTNNTFSTRSGENYHFNVGQNIWTKLTDKPTPWLTGQSGSVKTSSGEWIHICASGYGASAYLTQTEIFSDRPTSVKKNDAAVTQFEVFNIYPNPFNPSTTISYSLKSGGTVSIVVSDAGGRMIKQLTSEYRNAGEHSLHWNGRTENGIDAASGMYFLTLTFDSPAGTVIDSKRVVLIR